MECGCTKTIKLGPRAAQTFAWSNCKMVAPENKPVDMLHPAATNCKARPQQYPPAAAGRVCILIQVILKSFAVVILFFNYYQCGVHFGLKHAWYRSHQRRHQFQHYRQRVKWRYHLCQSHLHVRERRILDRLWTTKKTQQQLVWTAGRCLNSCAESATKVQSRSNWKSSEQQLTHIEIDTHKEEKNTLWRISRTYGPMSLTNLSSIWNFALPSTSAVMLPKLPTCRSSSPGSPWFLPKGLKWPPMDAKPWLRSPKICTEIPCAPGVRPVICPSISVGVSSVFCVKLMIPRTLDPSPSPSRWQVAFAIVAGLCEVWCSDYWSGEKTNTIAKKKK